MVWMARDGREIDGWMDKILMGRPSRRGVSCAGEMLSLHITGCWARVLGEGALFSFLQVDPMRLKFRVLPSAQC